MNIRTSDWQQTRLPGGVKALIGGAGPAVVLLPGWPETAEAYSEVFPILAQRFQALALDLPGLGGSDAPVSYDTGNIAEMLSAAVAPRHRTIHLVGHDVGGWIAYAWAAQFPDQVKSLTLLDCSIPGLTAPQSFPLPPEVNEKLWQFSFNTLPELPEALTSGRERVLFNWLFAHKAQKLDRIPQVNRDRYVEAYSRPGAMSRGFGYYRAATTSAAQNKKFSMSKLRMPVLASGGESGAGERMKESIEPYAARCEGGVIRDCGHYVMEEQPEYVADQIARIIERTEAHS